MEIDLQDPMILNFFKNLHISFVKRYCKKSLIEQFSYRLYLCVKCLEKGKCKFCKCKPEDMILEPLSCNSQDIFPNLMKDDEWDKFKIKNNIIIKNELYL